MDRRRANECRPRNSPPMQCRRPPDPDPPTIAAVAGGVQLLLHGISPILPTTTLDIRMLNGETRTIKLPSHFNMSVARPMIGALFNGTGADLVLVHGNVNGQRVCAADSMMVKDVAGPVFVIPKLEAAAPINAYFKALPKEASSVKLTWVASRVHEDGHVYEAEQSAAAGDTLMHHEFGEVKREGAGSVRGSLKVKIVDSDADSMEVDSKDCLFRGSTVKVGACVRLSVCPPVAPPATLLLHEPVTSTPPRSYGRCESPFQFSRTVQLLPTLTSRQT